MQYVMYDVWCMMFLTQFLKAGEAGTYNRQILLSLRKVLLVECKSAKKLTFQLIFIVKKLNMSLNIFYISLSNFLFKQYYSPQKTNRFKKFWFRSWFFLKILTPWGMFRPFDWNSKILHIWQLYVHYILQGLITKLVICIWYIVFYNKF